MTWLKTQLKQGIFGTGLLNAGVNILLAIAIICTIQLYYRFNHGPNIIFLKTPIDDLIPVVRLFVIPYITLWPIIFSTLVLFLLFRTRLYQSAALSIIAVHLTSYMFYFFLQSYIIRPQLTGTDIFTKLIQYVYTVDNPYNDFPSLHTSLSTVLAVHWLRIDKRIGLPVSAWVILIVLSTVFIKQHYIADIFGGLILAFGFSLLFLRIITKKINIKI
jgi:membrane-associated phospholipid phosphatase